MLVCNISLRPSRTAITATIIEISTAVDASPIGLIVFNTLIDDPASAHEIVNAYLGEIMVETANASDAVTIGLTYGSAVDESVTAADTVDGSSAVILTRSAMIAGLSPVFINPGSSREANVNGTMVNL